MWKNHVLYGLVRGFFVEIYIFTWMFKAVPPVLKEATPKKEVKTS